MYLVYCGSRDVRVCLGLGDRDRYSLCQATLYRRESCKRRIRRTAPCDTAIMTTLIKMLSVAFNTINNIMTSFILVTHALCTSHLYPRPLCGIAGLLTFVLKVLLKSRYCRTRFVVKSLLKGKGLQTLSFSSKEINQRNKHFDTVFIKIG